MPVEFTVFLFLMGLGCGLVSAQIKVSPALTCLTSLYFFLPAIDIPVENLISVIIASTIVACLPTHLYSWLKGMKSGQVEYALLLKYAPGFAMGGVIGAQLVSLASFQVILAFLSFSLLLSVFVSTMQWRYIKLQSIPNFPLPIGLLAGGISLLGGNDGHIVSRLLNHLHHRNPENSEGTLHGMSLFLSFAALIGFVFPAVPPSLPSMMSLGFGLIGSIYLPAATTLAVGLFLGTLLSHWQVSQYEHKILLVCFNLYLIVCLFRIWQ
ncbi:TSUP family transporter [Marinomonas posidonica]|uniref:TSUP family transporter n=1 Tax=Marinomonas posidonica TaxID=936476 RepID=UPI0037354103